MTMQKYEPEATRAESPSAEINDTLWSFGWQFGVTCFLALVFAGTAIYASDSFFGVAAIFVTVIPWHRGTRLINRNWSAVLNDMLKQAETVGAKQLKINQDEAKIYHLLYRSGSAVGIVPNRRYRITILYVGEKFLAIYDDARIDMVNRAFIRGSSTKELLYRDINSVDYSRPYFMIQTTSGDKLSFKSSDSDEESALKEIRKKLG